MASWDTSSWAVRKETSRLAALLSPAVSLVTASPECREYRPTMQVSSDALAMSAASSPARSRVAR